MLIFLSFLHEHICCGAHWKHLDEMLPISTHNICFLGRNEEMSSMDALLVQGCGVHVTQGSLVAATLD